MIALFGGTFNPIHYGHLLICEGIREEYNLEKVVFIPARIPPHKDKNEIIQASHRLEMAKLAIKDNPFFEVSDMELKREGSSYTIDTVRIYKNLYNIDRMGLILGADSLINFETWRNFTDIFPLVDIYVASRPDSDAQTLEKTIQRFENEFEAKINKYSLRTMDYSSTEIRDRISKGLSIKYLVPPAVEEYIYKAELYNDNCDGDVNGDK
ncbi:MAG: nicotinate-nucleotide adenylyltransferase [Acetivibrionales bacterium]|nr:nicotinate (nicotinamide) nucleotide adenylyltransferase [Clostridiaceae bacterium]